jgi:hypothetical protein
MRSRNPRRATNQRDLFLTPALLQWSDVPTAVRARTVSFLARLLRQHARGRRATGAQDE